MWSFSYPFQSFRCFHFLAAWPENLEGALPLKPIHAEETHQNGTIVPKNTDLVFELLQVFHAILPD